MITEHDLARSLSQIADEDSQPHEFRRRVDRSVAGRPRRTALRRMGPVLAVAACVVVIAAVALALTVLPPHGHQTAHPPATNRNPNVVATFSGTGNATRDVPAATAPAGRQTMLEILCNGRGKLRVNDYSVLSCAGGGSVGAGVAGQRTTPRELRIVTGPTVTWRIVVRFDIDYRTNGITETPADPLLKRTDTLAHASASGTGTVHIAAAPASRRMDVRVLVACTGSGLSLSSSSPGFNGQYTHTCVPNTSYAFDVSQVRLPTDFTVTASSSTTWHLVVLGQ